MAIIKCPECGKEISSSAPACPNCGYSRILAPQSNAKTKKNALIFITGIIAPLLLMQNSILFVVFVIGGAILELVLSLITIFSAMYFNGKRILLFMDFFLFDVGFALGILLSFVFKLRSCL